MNKNIYDVLTSLFEKQVEQLRNAKPKELKSLSKTKGLYLFSEQRGTQREPEHLYVGITGNLKQRHSQHRSNRIEQASFAVRLAREVCEAQTDYTSALSARSIFGPGGGYREVFVDAVERIKNMQLRVLELPNMNDDDLQILEMYAAKALKTPYNEFNLH
jgi:predicted GIY-YIG superfamily endonuclease